MAKRFAVEWLVLIACLVVAVPLVFIVDMRPSDPVEVFGFTLLFAPFVYLGVGVVRLTIASVLRLVR